MPAKVSNGILILLRYLIWFISVHFKLCVSSAGEQMDHLVQPHGLRPCGKLEQTKLLYDRKASASHVWLQALPGFMAQQHLAAISFVCELGCNLEARAAEHAMLCQQMQPAPT